MKDTGEETKKCKYCQSDIPKKAKVCPVCKKKQGGHGYGWQFWKFIEYIWHQD